MIVTAWIVYDLCVLLKAKLSTLWRGKGVGPHHVDIVNVDLDNADDNVNIVNQQGK